MADTVESMLARNCAPVLAGIKPSNLFSCPASCGIQLTAYRGLLESKGIRTFSVCACGSRTLTLVYRERLLRQQLNRADVQDCLRRFGYPVSG